MTLLWEWQQHDHRFLMRKRQFARLHPPLPPGPEEHERIDLILLTSPSVSETLDGRQVALHGLIYESQL